MSKFKKAFYKLHDIEGDFVDDPDDRGGATKYGVTETTARSWGYEGPMEDMPFSVALQIIKDGYWDIADLDEVAKIDYKLAYEIFEAGVNCGVGGVGKWVQRVINLMNKEQKMFGDIRVDGVIGPNTIDKMNIICARWFGTKILTVMVNVFQGYHYIKIAENDNSQEKFFWGWAKRVILGN